MIAFVRGVSLASRARASSCHVSGLESTKTGVAPQYFTALAVATKVRLGSSTSSSGPTPAAASARWRATVPFATAIPWTAPQKAANSRSNSPIKAPSELIQPERMASTTLASSSSPKTGAAMGIRGTVMAARFGIRSGREPARSSGCHRSPGTCGRSGLGSWGPYGSP